MLCWLCASARLCNVPHQRTPINCHLFICSFCLFWQAMEAAQLADDLRSQLELAQKKLHDFQDEIVENSVTKEKDMFNFKRAQVSGLQLFPCPGLNLFPCCVD